MLKSSYAAHIPTYEREVFLQSIAQLLADSNRDELLGLLAARQQLLEHAAANALATDKPRVIAPPVQRLSGQRIFTLVAPH